MNRIILLSLLLALISFNTMARGAGVVKGFDGGMMLHTGFVKGEFPQLAHTVSGMPFGIGGVIRAHLGEHWRLGSEVPSHFKGMESLRCSESSSSFPRNVPAFVSTIGTAGRTPSKQRYCRKDEN